MAGTDRSRAASAGVALAPAIILVAPQLGENIGAAARAMLSSGHKAEDQIIEWCLKHMAHYKVPRSVFLRHGLPVSGSGKLLRRMLQEPMAAAPAGLRFAYR